MDSQIFAIPVSVMAMVSLNYGLGLHIWDQKAEWHETYSKVCRIAYSGACVCSLTIPDGIRSGHLLSDISICYQDLSMLDLLAIVPIEVRQDILLCNWRFRHVIYGCMHIPYAFPVRSALSNPTTSANSLIGVHQFEDIGTQRPYNTVSTCALRSLLSQG
jgi:hypothetical protein